MPSAPPPRNSLMLAVTIFSVVNEHMGGCCEDKFEPVRWTEAATGVTEASVWRNRPGKSWTSLGGQQQQPPTSFHSDPTTSAGFLLSGVVLLHRLLGRGLG